MHFALVIVERVAQPIWFPPRNRSRPSDRSIRRAEVSAGSEPICLLLGSGEDEERQLSSYEAIPDLHADLVCWPIRSRLSSNRAHFAIRVVNNLKRTRYMLWIGRILRIRVLQRSNHLLKMVSTRSISMIPETPCRVLEHGGVISVSSGLRYHSYSSRVTLCATLTRPEGNCHRTLQFYYKNN